MLITDTGFHLKQIVGLINQIDLPAAPVEERFIRLERADATKAVEFLNSAFELKASTAAGGPRARRDPRARWRAGCAAPSAASAEDGQPIGRRGGRGGSACRRRAAISPSSAASP